MRPHLLDILEARRGAILELDPEVDHDHITIFLITTA
jgi:hypothetical protein